MKCCSPSAFVLSTVCPLWSAGRRGSSSLSCFFSFTVRSTVNPSNNTCVPVALKCVNAALEHCIRCLGNLGRHLACKESVPDQCIQPELVTGQNDRQHIRSKLQIRGTNRFMGILRILPLAYTFGLGGR